MPARVPSVTSADVAACSCISSFGTDTAGKISARRSEKSRAANRTRSGGTEVSTTTRIVVTCRSFQGRVRKLLDVLLRHRLLREPGGFEGLGMVGKESKPKQPAVPDLNHCRSRLIQLDAASATSNVELPQRDNQVALTPPVTHVDPPLLKLLVDLPRPLVHPAQTRVRLGSEAALDHEVGIDLTVGERPFPPIPGVDPAFDEFDVLLRHRPRSISRRRQAVRASSGACAAWASATWRSASPSFCRTPDALQACGG